MTHTPEAMTNLADRLESHVSSRGGPAKDADGKPIGTTWPMMLEAAAALRYLAAAQSGEPAGNYSISVSWSDEDQAFIAIIPELPGCMADGQTRIEALRELAGAQTAWVEACNSAGNSVPGYRDYNDHTVSGAEQMREACANNLDPASATNDELLRLVHALIECHGRKYPERYVPVFYRNIVLGFVAAALRGEQPVEFPDDPVAEYRNLPLQDVVSSIIVDELRLDWHGREAAEATRAAVTKAAGKIVRALADRALPLPPAPERANESDGGVEGHATDGHGFGPHHEREAGNHSRPVRLDLPAAGIKPGPSDTAPALDREAAIAHATWALCADADGAGQGRCSKDGCDSCKRDARICVDTILALQSQAQVK